MKPTNHPATRRKNIRGKNSSLRKRKPNITRKMRGGRKRVEKVITSFGRQHTSPDIQSEYKIIKGPTAYKGKGRLGYLVNFFRTTSNNFEEELAQTILGVPQVDKKVKKYELVFHDNDSPMAPGAEKALPKCKTGDTKKK